ncbi:hypothetical protein FKQ73_15080 [Vibrio sp. B8-1]|uniref:hypothetical protein n=1 Tax=Vibrio sp. B8-1 TaxID=2591469 RepID=UPI0014827B67|nr:hypothetical protein [Vibrio sp. B8-1]NNN93865.1 hypothetical protein [Vibrio sp. B8-1]
MKINVKYIAFVLLSISPPSASVFAAELCLADANITAIEVGFVESSGSECPDGGNCIRFEYENNTALGMNSSGHSYVHYKMNLDDGQKGMTMYNMLKTAMIFKYPVIGLTTNGYCKDKPSIDSINIY